VAKHGIEVAVIQRVPSFSLLQSGLSLFHTAGNRALSAAAALSSGSPDVLLEGVLALQTARNEAGIAAAVVQTAQELDEALLDILV
jgi:hypothetical protein